MQLFGQKKHLNSRLPELLEGCRKGDNRAQKALYDSLAPKMFAVCLRYMGNRDAAQDVLQDGFVTLFSKLQSFEGTGSFEGWARRIFVNTALMSLRKNDILRQTEEVETARNVSVPDPSAIQNLGYKELLKLVSELPDGFRTIFNMYVIEGYSHKEIAEELGITEATSRSQLMRARAVLQNRIKEL